MLCSISTRPRCATAASMLMRAMDKPINERLDEVERALTVILAHELPPVAPARAPAPAPRLVVIVDLEQLLYVAAGTIAIIGLIALARISA